MKFSEFQPNAEKEYDNVKKNNPDMAKSVEDKMKQYENLSQTELMQEFIKESKIQKQNGNLDSKKISNIKESLLPFLNTDQKKQLDYLLGMVDDD